VSVSDSLLLITGHHCQWLQDLMKTQAGRRVAQQRHDFMHQFVDQFLAEVGGRA
jgi:HD superfamily phosphodiesterase